MRHCLLLSALLLAACQAPSGSATSPVKGEAASVVASPFTGEVPARAEGAPTPAPTRTPIWKDQVFIDYKAKLAAAKDDPRQTARLFMAAFAHYDEDRAFALDLMSAAAASGLVHDDPNCRSGKLFNKELDPLWIAMDGHPKVSLAYFDSPENALAPDADAHVQLDETGTSIAADTATIALKPTGAAARTAKLDKQSDGWRVSEFKNLVEAL